MRITSYLNVEDYKGQTLTLRGAFDRGFLEAFCQRDTSEQEPLKRPLLHFTAAAGLDQRPQRAGIPQRDSTICIRPVQSREYPVAEHVLGALASARDLLHFEQTDDAPVPRSALGAAYSGCGLVNDRGLLGLPKDALLFCDTAAGGLDCLEPQRSGAGFTQRIAYSLDEGQTLIRKLPEAAIEVLREDSRDPKIFWHDETKAYVMVLWLEGT